MKPIISPWLIYALNVLGNAQEILIAVFFIGLFGILGFFLGGFILEAWKSVDSACHAVKPYVIAFCIYTVVLCFIPTKEQVYQMIVASQITPNNIQTVTQVAGDTAEDVADYVIDIITRVSEATQKGE